MTNAWDDLLEKRHGKATGQRAALSGATESEATIKSRVQAQEVERATGINAICELAGKPDRAATFIASSQTLSEVIAMLSSERTNGREHPPGSTAATIAHLHTPRARRA